MTTEPRHEDSIAPQAEPPKPKLCIHCEHIGTNGSHDAEKYRCFAPENRRGIDLVTGEATYAQPTCYAARQKGHCGHEAVWFKQADVRPKKVVIPPLKQITTRPISVDLLLKELEGP